MGSLTDLLGRTPRVAIVEAFAEHPELEFSVPEIVRQTRISKRGVYLHIAKLLEEGLVRKATKLGKCQFYRVNENDRRGELLPILESAFTLGKIEREIKRDRGIPPQEPLEVRFEFEEAIGHISLGESGASRSPDAFIDYVDVWSAPGIWTVKAPAPPTVGADLHGEIESQVLGGTTATGIARGLAGNFETVFSKATNRKPLVAAAQR